MDGHDLELFERSLRHATETLSGRPLDDALAELGWDDALAVDRRAAVSVLFALQGRSATTSGALDRVVATALGTEVAPHLGVVLPTIDTWAPPGVVEDGTLRVEGVVRATIAEEASVLVVAAAGEGTVAVEAPAAALEQRRVHGVDPWIELVEVRAERIEIDPSAAPPVDWTAAIADAHRALAHELVGSARTMLELARTHALEREQFGRPIAAFQAVRHRLAETLVAVETAEAVIDAAWLDGSPGTAAMAKAVAGREARTASKHCQQVLAGIGFTTEHDLHRFIRRALVLDGLLGTARSLTEDLGRQLLGSHRLPPLLPL